AAGDRRAAERASERLRRHQLSGQRPIRQVAGRDLERVSGRIGEDLIDERGSERDGAIERAVPERVVLIGERQHLLQRAAVVEEQAAVGDRAEAGGRDLQRALIRQRVDGQGAGAEGVRGSLSAELAAGQRGGEGEGAGSWTVGGGGEGEGE